MKAYKITISGDYRSDNREVVDFDNVVGYVPVTDDDLVYQCVRHRYAEMWIRNDERYTRRFRTIRVCEIVSQEEVDYDFSYVGKDVREMSYSELQDLATAKQLSRIPAFRKSGLLTARKVAYGELMEKMKGKKLDLNDETFSLSDMPPLVVDGSVDNVRKMKPSISDIIDQQTNLTVERLKEILDEKGIAYHHRAGFDKLYELAFGEQ